MDGWEGTVHLESYTNYERDECAQVSLLENGARP